MAAPIFEKHKSESPRNVSQDVSNTEEYEDDDPHDKMIRKTGCLQRHHDVQVFLILTLSSFFKPIYNQHLRCILYTSRMSEKGPAAYLL